MPLPQLSRLVPRQVDTAAADTALADTLSLAERLRADSTVIRLVDPGTQLHRLWTDLQVDLLDSALWLGVIAMLFRVALVLILAFLAIRIVERVTGRWMKRFEDLPPIHPRRQRAFTISNLVASSTRYFAWPIAIIMVLGEVNVDVGALIATAGIAGLAIGFGAQTLVKDVISGVFLLFDDSIHVGDIVRVGTEAGTVEYIGVRLLKVRKFDGELLMVPAGELRIFGNKSIGYARVIVEVGLSYEQDVETILPVMKRVADEWAADHREVLLEDEPDVQALTAFGESSVTARVVMMVIPGEQFAAERELRILLKREFDRLGIEIPFPRRMLYVRQEAEPPDRSIVDPETVAPRDEGALGSD